MEPLTDNDLEFLIRMAGRYADECDHRCQPFGKIAWDRLTQILAGLRDGSLVAVPREPTRAMVDAGWATKRGEMPMTPRDVWMQMLSIAAAPEPSADRVAG